MGNMRPGRPTNADIACCASTEMLDRLGQCRTNHHGTGTLNNTTQLRSGSPATRLPCADQPKTQHR
eukprot:729071-Lingulodinium_polyedra.AAC.1